ncbi:ParB/RepB/Spo0J family partition protein [Streptococcus panodentis]|nr:MULTISPECIES: ParB/RepB/Spo0J family partition protein [Streptococcus]KXT84896.1 Chromosome (plasmid) partitioning protein ParB / Stage 0 sporulation protein J [Streptococcus sp. DD11]
MENFQYIPLTDIRTNPYQPRKEFSQEKIKELADSIKENGIIQPIILRKSSLFGYEILAGERRFRAAKLLDWPTIPAIIKELSDDEMLRQAIIENLQREDLNPVEEAESYQSLVDRGMTHDEIAKIMGKSRPYISNIVRLLHVSKPVLEAVKEERISQGHARLLIPLKEEEQLLWLKRICQEELSVRAVELLLQKKKKAKQKKTKEIFTEAEEEKLKKIFGLDIRIQLKNASQGKIIIPFENEEEYQRIMNSFK